MSDQSKKWVLRIDNDTYSRLKLVSDIKKINLSTAGDIALNMFADSIEYSYENLLRLIDEQPALKLEKPNFERMFKDADQETLEAIVKLLKKEGHIDYYDLEMDELDRTLLKIEEDKCLSVVPILRINVKTNPNEEIRTKIREFFKKVNNLPCETNGQMMLDPSFEKEDKESLKVLFFVLKKEEITKNEQAT